MTIILYDGYLFASSLKGEWPCITCMGVIVKKEVNNNQTMCLWERVRDQESSGYILYVWTQVIIRIMPLPTEQRAIWFGFKL